MLFAASLIDGAFEAFGVALSRQDLFAQPMAEGLGIFNCRFPEAVQLANLCTMILNSAPAPLIPFELLRRDFDLLCDKLHRHRRYGRCLLRKVRFQLKKLQQHRKAEPGRASLVR
jgi:hypothetical protein